MKYVTDRTRGPRDVISFFNKCIEVAEGKPKVTVDAVRRAEGEYSRQRLRALADEWHADYPGLLDFVGVLKKQPPSFPLDRITDDDIADICLKVATKYPVEPGILRSDARHVANDALESGEFKRKLFMAFYRVGLVGLKLETFEAASWVDQSGQSVSTAEIEESTGIVVRTTYWRALGVDSRKGR